MNVLRLADEFAEAVKAMEIAWAILKGERYRFHPRLMARFIRTLHRCHRIRTELDEAIRTGKL